MRDLFWLTKEQLALINPFFPLARGVPHGDDRRVVSGIILVIKNGLRWRDAPTEYGPHKPLYNRFKRWSRMGVFDTIFTHLAVSGAPPDTLMIDARHLEAHRTASSLLEKGMFPAISGVRKAGCTPNSMPLSTDTGVFS